MNLSKKDNETNLEYIIRLVQGKSDGTYDIDYTELFKLLFDVELSSCESRKRYYGIKMLLPYIDLQKMDNLTSKEILDEIEKKKIEVQKEKYKVQTLRLDLNKNIRESSRSDLLFEQFVAEIKNQAPLPYPEFKPLKKQDGKKAYVLSFADAHYGKEFESLTNVYDLDIVRERFNRLLGETLEIIQENNISHLTVLSLGDLIDGMIRISQIQSLKIGIVEQTIGFMRFIVSWLNKLSEYVNIDYYQTVSSNHSQIRPFNAKPNEFVKEDMERIIYTYIHDMLKDNNRIKIHECEDKFLIFKILRFNIIANHGHGIKNPSIFLKDAIAKHRIFFDYAFFGHMHHTKISTVAEGYGNNCDVINVPSIMGCDIYADDLITGSKAGATLIEFTERQGKRKTYDIILN